MLRTTGFGKSKAVVSERKSRGRREAALGREWTHEANDGRHDRSLRVS